jgi:DNA gyrase subunit A
LIIVGDGPVVIATQHGYGKLTDIDEFPRQGRGGQGVIAIRTSERNGAVVGALQVSQDDELMLISQIGTLVRTPVSEVSVMGRNTQGVRLIRLDEGDRLVGLERVEGLQDEDAAADE